MHAIFRMCGNESQPGLQPVEKLAMPLVGKNMWERQTGLLVSTSGSKSTYPTSSAIREHTKATGHKFSLDSARILTRRKNLVTKKIRDALQIYQRHLALNRDQGYNVAPVLLSHLSRDYIWLHD